MNTDRDTLRKFLSASGFIPAEMAERISQDFRDFTLIKSDYFLRQGEVSDTYLFLESGFMRAYAISSEGDEVTTGFFSNRQLVFEVSSFFTRTPSAENIVALSDCKGYTLTFAELNALFHGMQEFREFGRNILVKGFAALKTRMLSTITETAEIRYERLMKEHPEILQQAPLKYIASYLGVTDTSLSRIRKEFAKK